MAPRPTKADARLLLIALTFTLMAFTVYMLFFDILIPGLPDGSYRKAVGSLFAIPAFLLAIGQTGIGGFFINGLAVYFGAQGRLDKALLVASALTMMFSLTYAMFPNYGPFYYIVFATGGPGYALPVEIIWSLAMAGVGTLLCRRVFGLRARDSFLIVASVLIGITVAAS